MESNLKLLFQLIGSHIGYKPDIDVLLEHKRFITETKIDKNALRNAIDNYYKDKKDNEYIRIIPISSLRLFYKKELKKAQTSEYIESCGNCNNGHVFIYVDNNFNETPVKKPTAKPYIEKLFVCTCPAGRRHWERKQGDKCSWESVLKTHKMGLVFNLKDSRDFVSNCLRLRKENTKTIKQLV